MFISVYPFQYLVSLGKESHMEKDQLLLLQSKKKRDERKKLTTGDEWNGRDNDKFGAKISRGEKIAVGTKSGNHIQVFSLEE